MRDLRVSEILDFDSAWRKKKCPACLSDDPIIRFEAAKVLNEDSGHAEEKRLLSLSCSECSRRMSHMWPANR